MLPCRTNRIQFVIQIPRHASVDTLKVITPKFQICSFSNCRGEDFWKGLRRRTPGGGNSSRGPSDFPGPDELKIIKNQGRSFSFLHITLLYLYFIQKPHDMSENEQWFQIKDTVKMVKTTICNYHSSFKTDINPYPVDLDES